MTTAVVSVPLGLWLTLREPPELDRSRAIKLGMSELEAQAVMGRRAWQKLSVPNVPMETWIVFGTATTARSRLADFLTWLKLPHPIEIEFPDWPVRVRLDQNGRVDRIERGDHIESRQPDA